MSTYEESVAKFEMLIKRQRYAVFAYWYAQRKGQA